MRDVMPRPHRGPPPSQKTPETQRNQASILQYWRRVLGHKLLSEITPRDLAEQRDVPLKTKKASTVVYQLRCQQESLSTDRGTLTSRCPHQVCIILRLIASRHPPYAVQEGGYSLSVRCLSTHHRSHLCKKYSRWARGCSSR